MMKKKQCLGNRAAFTLVELMLSLTLVVVATAILGSLMQLYSRNFATKGDDIRRQQLAKAVLHMMAEDIRSVVLKQEYDTSVLEQLLGSGGSGGAPTGGAALGGDSGLAGDAASGELASSISDTSSYGSEGDLVEDVSSERELGIYGDQFTLMVDVSRVPRPDQYMGEMASPMTGVIADIPGDLKTVTYFIQSATSQGVQDNMSNFTRKDASETFASGLVRRALDRRVLAYAEEIGDVDRLSRTGEIVAPEVVALEFSYFDGTEWLIEWDSTQQGLPWLIRMNIAIQSASDEENGTVEPGISLSTLSLADRQAYGIEIFELVVAIPGANLQAADAAAQDQAAGMSSVGL